MHSLYEHVLMRFTVLFKGLKPKFIEQFTSFFKREFCMMHAGCFKFTNQCNKFPQDPNMVQNQAKRFFKVDFPNKTFTESYSSFLLKVSGLPYCLITSRNRDRLVVTLFGICFTGRNLWILEASLALPT